MVRESEIHSARYIAGRAAQVSLALMALFSVAVVVALVYPIHMAKEIADVSNAGKFASIVIPKQDLQGVLSKLVNREVPLISPPQIQAAVKDSGVAAKLAKRLKLQGIICVGGEYVAYVQVEEQGVKTVKKGESLLDFVVQDVTAQRVTLSLEGVEVVLGH